MADDLSKSFKWGCGVTTGVVFALFALPLIGLSILLFLACGGCTLVGGLMYGTKEVASRAAANATSAQAPRSTPPTARSADEQSVGIDERDRQRKLDEERRKLAEQQKAQEAEQLRQAEQRRRDREAAEKKRREDERKQAAAEAKDEKYARTLLDLARDAIKAGDVTSARKNLKSLLQSYPSTKAAEEAKKLLESIGK